MGVQGNFPSPWKSPGPRTTGSGISYGSFMLPPTGVCGSERPRFIWRLSLKRQNPAPIFISNQGFRFLLGSFYPLLKPTEFWNRVRTLSGFGMRCSRWSQRLLSSVVIGVTSFCGYRSLFILGFPKVCICELFCFGTAGNVQQYPTTLEAARKITGQKKYQ